MSKIRTLAVSSAIALLACGSAWAGGTAASTADADYQRERAACLEGRTQQSQADCLKEARNAAADKRRGLLESGITEQQLAANREARCNYVAAEDREQCRRMANGEGTVSGSVEGGGLYKELVTRSVGEPAATVTQ
jgi:hypothetical protein